MISLTDIEAMKEIFPKESEQLGKEREKIGIQKGREQGIQKGREQGIQKGREQGKLEEKIKTAENMKKEDIDTPIIAKITGLSLEEIEKL